MWHYEAMKGLLKPCRHRLGRELHARWLSHLCGLCLALRDSAGQSARVLTGYDVLLVPVLTEAQAGPLPTHTAGACALRGFRTAAVVDSGTAAMQAGTAVALLAGGAGLTDKVDDGDAPVWLRPMVAHSARRLARTGGAAADACGLDGRDLLEAPARARSVESRAGASLAELLAPTGSAVATMFAHTAIAAGVPANTEALRRAGDAFGRLVHLVDATEDRETDRRHNRFNPLDVTGTSAADAGKLARSLHHEILGALDNLSLVDDALAKALLGPTLGATIDRTWAPDPTREAPLHPRRRREVVVALAAAMVAQVAVFGGGGWSGGGGRWGGGGSWGGGRGGPWGNGPYGPYGNDPYYGRPGYGGRGGYGGGRGGCGGPSCGQMLACDCCANCACDECCGGDSVCCCV